MDAVTISINGKAKTVLCGLCNAPITRGAESGGDGSNTAGCQRCGNFDHFDKVAEIAKAHATDTLQLAINRAMKGVAARSKILKFSGKTINDKAYRFIVDLQS